LFIKYTIKQIIIYQGPIGLIGTKGNDGPVGVPGVEGLPGPKGIEGVAGNKVCRNKMLNLKVSFHTLYRISNIIIILIKI